jgi:hypothetical protein
LRQITAVRRGRSKMENTNGKSRASFRCMLSCAAIGLVVSISPCFAQGNRMQHLGTAPPEIMTPFKCDSLDPKVCFDIYSRLHNESQTRATALFLGPCDSLDPRVCLDIYRRGMESPKAFDLPKDWNTAIDERGKSKGLIEPPKGSNPVIGLTDPPKDWFTAIRRGPWPVAVPKDGTRIK